jgi:hypothetical protein
MADPFDTHASARLHKRHQRYANFSRLNHSKQELEFLSVEALRLGTTTANIFHLLDSYTAGQIRGAANLAAL